MGSAWQGLLNNREITQLPHYAFSKNLPVDSYYTSTKTAKKCMQLLNTYLKENRVCVDEYTFIEPGAGCGNFYDIFPHDDKIAIDLLYRRDDFIVSDFLKWFPQDLTKKYISVGNPPFGVRGAIALAFINRCFLFSDYVAFILPMSFYSNGKGSNMKRVINGHLVFSEILQNEKFHSPDNNKEINVNTLFQIWKKGEGKGLFENYDCSEFIEIYTVCSSPGRICGIEDLTKYDFFISSTFFGETLSTVYSFDDVKYGSGYGVVIKKEKEKILKSIDGVEWNDYSSLGTNSCKHIRKHKIQKCFYDLGFGTKN